MRLVGFSAEGGLIYTILVAVVGAVILMVAFSAWARRPAAAPELPRPTGRKLRKKLR